MSTFKLRLLTFTPNCLHVTYTIIVLGCLETENHEWLTPELIVKILDGSLRCDAQYQAVYFEKRLKVCSTKTIMSF
jgi:hypothetical protein